MDSNADSVLMENEMIVPVSIEFRHDLNRDDLEMLCRLCGNSSHQLMPIFSGDGAEHSLPEKIREHLPIIDVYEDDILPSSICYQCASTLIAWHELYYACKDADHRLRDICTRLKEFNSDSKENLMVVHDDDVLESNYEDSEEFKPILEVDKSLYKSEVIPLRADDPLSCAEDPHSSDCIDSCNDNDSVVHSDQMGESSTSTKENADLPNDRNRLAVILSNISRGNVPSSIAVNIHTSSAEIDAISHVELPFPRTCSSGSFQCYKCNRRFMSEIFLNMHYNEGRIVFANPPVFHTLYRSMKCHPLVPPDKIDRNLPFICGQCDQTFETKKKLKIHIYCYHPCIPKYKCDFCSKYFVTECDLAEHRVEHSANRLLICLTCGFRYGSGTLPYETDKSRIILDMCSCKHKSKLSTVEKENKSALRRPPFEPKKVEENNEETTILDTVEDMGTVCRVCGKEFRTRLSLKRHYRIHKNAVECKFCGKKYSKAYLRVHLLIHSQEKKFVCQTCGKSFAQSSSLRSHQLLENNFQKFVCNVCGMRFVLSSRFQSHLKTHLEDMPFKCEDCGRGYGYIWQLKQHRIRHSNVRPYSCEKCGRSYKTMKHLRQHYAVHRKD